ncbi:MAG: Appr-1-p processing protein [Gammaproteobacteria bacterium]|nr:Appr-1-p processing protein [Gammaproteobacteria bacterium]MBU1623894.1 Appr-1-p processing protein [Gammaproteobacteria bacterium]MBU1982111.1 Appr-1-p processing protein [Gammaproteobacteria bacterium]
MLHELTGDILLSEAKAIVHGVAPNDDFHQGLALQLRERMPALYKDFRHYCQTQHPKSGTKWSWMSADGRFIVNLFTQEGAYDHGSKPGHATLSHVNHALHALRGFAQKEKLSSMALPRLACGVGGLDWNDVKPLIEHQLGDLGIPIYLYVSYQKGSKASEPK